MDLKHKVLRKPVPKIPGNIIVLVYLVFQSMHNQEDQSLLDHQAQVIIPANDNFHVLHSLMKFRANLLPDTTEDR